MNFKIKRIIAREFILFIVALVICMLTYLTTFIYNWNIQRKTRLISNEIIRNLKVSDSLSINYHRIEQNQYWLYKELTRNFDAYIADYDSQKNMWKRLSHLAKSDSLKYKWYNKSNSEFTNFFISIGFKNSDSLKTYISENTFTTEIINQKRRARGFKTRALILREDKEKLEKKIVVTAKQLDLAVISLGFSVLILFVLRYLYVGLAWSIRILKQNNTSDRI